MKKEFIFRAVLAAAIFFLVYQFGVKPFLSLPDKNVEKDKHGWLVRLPTAEGKDYDVVVYGAEPQGISAAISAARHGARTLLISEGRDIGGIIERCLIPTLEVPTSQNNLLLNGGILSELYGKLDSAFSVDRYISTVNDMLAAEKGLTVIYDSELQGVNINEGNIESLKLLSGGEAKVVSGRMFIDASDSGRLLEACKVPYFTGSGDLNLPDCFMPAGLNFIMAPPDDNPNRIYDAKKLANDADEFYKGIKEYKPLDLRIRMDELSLFFPGDGAMLIQGLRISNVNALSREDINKAYETAKKEAENLALFMSEEFKQLNGWKLLRTAPELRVREFRHFNGKYMLTVNDILDNKYFDETVAMGSYPVLADKFTEKGSYVIGKPVQYGIPLGCLVPEKINNLLMAGPHISFSSLAATSAGTIGVGIATGEAAGATAVFCLARNENPSFLVGAREEFSELRNMLEAQKMYLPYRKITGKNSGNWSYPALRQLTSLGLVAGGKSNNFRFDEPAKQRDLAYILLNGIYRLDRNSYSIDLDARIRPYITDDALTFGNTVEILGVLYGIKGNTTEIYDKLCAQSRINSVMQLRMKDKKPLTMDDVYYLGAYTIRSFTGKDMPD